MIFKFETTDYHEYVSKYTYEQKVKLEKFGFIFIEEHHHVESLIRFTVNTKHENTIKINSLDELIKLFLPTYDILIRGKLESPTIVIGTIDL